MPDENSMKIVTTAKFYLAGHNGGIAPFLFPDIFFGQYAWIVEYIDTNNQHHIIINGRNNWIDTNYVHGFISHPWMDGNGNIYKHQPYPLL